MTSTTNSSSLRWLPKLVVLAMAVSTHPTSGLLSGHPSVMTPQVADAVALANSQFPRSSWRLTLVYTRLWAGAGGRGYTLDPTPHSNSEHWKGGFGASALIFVGRERRSSSSQTRSRHLSLLR